VSGNAALVTTEKDFVRLSIQQRENIRVLKINAVFDDTAAMSTLLDSRMPAV
jgi:tetraacyldisaccharide-1-P 4'-kinase